MARSFVSASALFSSNTIASSATLSPWSISAGSLVVVGVRTETADATVSFSDDQGGSWTAVKLRNSINVWIAYSWNHPGGDTLVTATFSVSQGFRRMQGVELSGGDSVDPLIGGANISTVGSALPLDHTVNFSGLATVVSVQGNISSTTYSIVTGTKFTSSDAFICGSYTLSSSAPVQHQNTGAVGATANLSVAFAEPSVVDSTAPTLSGPITLDSATSSTLDFTLPTPSDNLTVDHINYRVDGGAWVDNGLSLAVSLTGLDALTPYLVEAQAFDEAGNPSAIVSITASTYRVGASAGSIVAATGPQDGNPAGPLHALAMTLPVDTWVSYRTISGPTPSGGTLIETPSGSGSYTGPSPAVWTIQPEVDGADYGDPVVVTLYDPSALRAQIPAETAGAPADLDGVMWAWWDSYPPNFAAAPDLFGALAASGEPGALDIDLTGTALARGDTGTLALLTGDGVEGSTANLGFIGPVVVR